MNALAQFWRSGASGTGCPRNWRRDQPAHALQLFADFRQGLACRALNDVDARDLELRTQQGEGGTMRFAVRSGAIPGNGGCAVQLSPTLTSAAAQF